MSLPLRGAWIEISVIEIFMMIPPSLPLRGAWIEIELGTRSTANLAQSLPLRGAWIEILFGMYPEDFDIVAPPAGSVD